MADDLDNIFLHPRYEYNKRNFPRPRTYEERQILAVARDSTASTYQQRWHDRFVNGKAIFGTGNGCSSSGLVGALGLHDGPRDMEFRPELPAPKERPPRTNPFYAHSAEDLLTARDPTNPNYFSDGESERTASVAEEYQEAERAEKAAAGINEDTTTQQQSAGLKRKRSASASQFESTSRAKRHWILDPILDQMAGRGRGRGGGGMLKGVTWEYDPSIKLESKPIELFPPHPNLKRPAPLTDKEKREIGHYKRLQSQVHRGPLYTQPTKRDATAPAKTFGEDQFNRQYSTNPKADFDPFTGVETYSQRLQPKVNAIPKFSGRPFNKELFPKELWPALEGEEGNEVRKHLERAKEKKDVIMSGTKDKKLDDKQSRVLEKLLSVPADEDVEDVDEDQEQDVEVDSDFDDESMGGDYDAEQYFDNGDDNSEGEGGGGDENYE